MQVTGKSKWSVLGVSKKASQGRMTPGVSCREAGVHFREGLGNLVKTLDLTEGHGSSWRQHDLTDLSFEQPFRLP